MMKSEIPSPRRQPCIDATSRSPIQTAHPANSTDPYIKVPLELKLQVKLPRCVGERSYGLLIKVLREGWPKMRCSTCRGRAHSLSRLRGGGPESRFRIPKTALCQFDWQSRL